MLHKPTIVSHFREGLGTGLNGVSGPSDSDIRSTSGDIGEGELDCSH